jgi:hypothetical protein
VSQHRQTGLDYSVLAADLIGRAASTQSHWHTPGSERFGMTPDAAAALQRVQYENAAGLKRIVERIRSWPGRSTVGAQACQAAVDIAVHSDHDPAFQQTLLRLLDRAVRSGEATSAQLAHLHDRCLVNAGQPQMYGTQHWYGPDGSLAPHPIADPDELDTRRAGAGLPPYGERAGRLREHHVPPASSRRSAGREAAGGPGTAAAA